MTTYEAIPIPGSQCDLGEGTLWDERSKRFVWVDVFDGLVKTYDPSNGDIKEHIYKSMVTYVGKRTSGGYVLALGDSIALTDGNFNKSIHRKNIHIANGIDWSIDRKMMFYIDSATREISRYKFDPQRNEIVSELTPIDVSDVTGLPDGMCTDSLSNIWVAFYGCGQVRNYTPDGELLNIVQAPTALTTCASFGGKDLKTLFVTSVKDYRSPEFAFDPKNDPYGGMCFEVELPIAGKLDFSFNA